MPDLNERASLGFVLGASSAVCFSLAAPFTRLAIENGVVPVDAVALRALTAFFAVGLFVVVRRVKFSLTRSTLLSIVGLGVSTSLIAIAYLSSVAFIPVGLAVIIFFTFPLIIIMIAPVIEKTPFGWRRFLVGMVALCGLYLAIGPSLSHLDGRGIALAFGGSLGAVGQFFFNRAIAHTLSAPVIAWTAHVVIVPITLLASLIFGGRLLTFQGDQSVTTLGAVAVAVICVGYVCAYMFQVYALKNAPPSKVALAYNIEPIFSTLLAAAMFAERLSVNQYAGGLLVLAALVLSSMLLGKPAGPQNNEAK